MKMKLTLIAVLIFNISGVNQLISKGDSGVTNMENEPLEIQLFADTHTDFCSYSLDCTGDAIFNFKVINPCLGGEVTVTGSLDLFSDGIGDGIVHITGEFPYYQIEETYGLGAHELVLYAADGCGNTAVLNIPFQVVDCRVLQPACVAGMVAAFWSSDGSWSTPIFHATDLLDNDSIPDCSGIKGYSIHKSVQVEEGSDIPHYPHPAIEISCADEKALTIVRIYVWDNANNPYSLQPDGSMGGANYDYCETFIWVQDFCDFCECYIHSSIGGDISSITGEPIPNVSVTLTGDVNDESITHADGTYSFTNFNYGSDLIITPSYDVAPLNGVSTFDLVLIAKHILNIRAITDPYKMIAADVNNSGSISTIDLIQLRKLILGIYEYFPANTSWRFVDASYVFVEGNPFLEPFPEAIGRNNVFSDIGDVDFVGVKVGDVNGSAVVE